MTTSATPVSSVKAAPKAAVKLTPVQVSAFEALASFQALPAKDESPISKYRVHVMDIASGLGWVRAQVSTATDTFTKGDTAVTVTYGSTQVIGAQVVQGTTIKDQALGAKGAKLQRISTWLGQPMELKAKWNLSTAAKDALTARVAQAIKVIPSAAPSS